MAMARLASSRSHQTHLIGDRYGWAESSMVCRVKMIDTAEMIAFFSDRGWPEAVSQPPSCHGRWLPQSRPILWQAVAPRLMEKVTAWLQATPANCGKRPKRCNRFMASSLYCTMHMMHTTAHSSKRRKAGWYMVLHELGARRGHAFTAGQI